MRIYTCKCRARSCDRVVCPLSLHDITSHEEESDYEALAQMIIFHLMLLRACEEQRSCPFSRWGSWGFQRPPPHKVNLVVKNITITLWQQAGVGSRMRQGKMPSLPSEFKAQLSRIPSQMIYVPVLITLPFIILEASLGEELYLF